MRMSVEFELWALPIIGKMNASEAMPTLKNLEYTLDQLRCMVGGLVGNLSFHHELGKLGNIFQDQGLHRPDAM